MCKAGIIKKVLIDSNSLVPLQTARLSFFGLHEWEFNRKDASLAQGTFRFDHAFMGFHYGLHIT